MSVGLIQTVEGLKKNTDFPEEEETLPEDCLQTRIAASTPSWAFRLPAYPADFEDLLVP